MPELREYQKAAVRAVVEDGISYLHFDAGLGKTAIALSVCGTIGAKRVLIVCPATVRLVWQAEIERWWPKSPEVTVVDGTLSTSEAFVYIVNYDKLSQSGGKVDYLAELTAIGKAAPFDIIIIDEAQALKNPKSKRTTAVFNDLLPLANRVVALSGTPAPNHAGELYAPIAALAPELLLLSNGTVMSQFGFESTFCEVEEKHVGGGRTVRQIVGSRNLGQLREMLKTFMLRETKARVLRELPPLKFVTSPIAPSKICSQAQTSFDASVLDKMSDDEFLAWLRGGDEHVARLRKIIGLAKVEPCGEYILSELADNRRKAVVWAEHHDVIDAMTEKLAALSPVKIDGRDDMRSRQFAVQRFLENPSCRIFIGNIKAAGTGLTLVSDRFECSDAYFVEASYTPGENYQAACRIHRIGQRDAVLARMFVASKTMDERVMQILTRKTNDLAELFERETVDG